MAENRIKCLKRVQKCRKIKKEAEQSQDGALHFSHSYETESDLRKDVAKAMRALPSSASKRKAVVAELFNSLDAKDRQDIINSINTFAKTKKEGLSSALVGTMQLFYKSDDVSITSPNVEDTRYFVNTVTGEVKDEMELNQMRHFMFVEDYRGKKFKIRSVLSH